MPCWCGRCRTRIPIGPRSRGKGPDPGVAWPNFEDWRQPATSFDGLACSLTDAVVLTSGEFPRRFDRVASRPTSFTCSAFVVPRPPLPRVRRAPDCARDRRGQPRLLDARARRRRRGDRPDIFFRSPFTVIGVLPPDFRYVAPADVYLLLDCQVGELSRMQSRRTAHDAVARRLKPGSACRGRTELQTIAAASAFDTRTTKGQRRAARRARRSHRPGLAPTLTVLTGAVALLLPIACVGLVSLLLNRSAAGPTNSASAPPSAGAAGGGSASSSSTGAARHARRRARRAGRRATLTGLVAWRRATCPASTRSLDRAVLVLDDALQLCRAFPFGARPPSGVRLRRSGRLFAVRPGARPGQRRSPRRRPADWGSGGREVLLPASGLMVHTMQRLSSVDPGFDPHNLQTVMFSLAGPAWPDPRKQAFFAEAVERLQAVPGVENAALTYSLPSSARTGGTGSRWPAGPSRRVQS